MDLKVAGLFAQNWEHTLTHRQSPKSEKFTLVHNMIAGRFGGFIANDLRVFSLIYPAED